MQKQHIPLLEYSDKRSAIIDPDKNHPHLNIPKNCLICFFHEAIEKLDQQGKLETIYTIPIETMHLPVYQIDVNGTPVTLLQGFLGGPGIAISLEILNAIGGENFLVLGGAGALTEDLGLGHLLIPNSAIRDEGTSYHYLPPSREVEADPVMVQKIADALTQRNIKHQIGKTWTTDAFFRETKEKVDLRKSEGALVVEMEAATLFAVAQFRNINLGQILYAGDDVSGDDWDDRSWDSQEDLRMNLLNLALEICSEF